VSQAFFAPRSAPSIAPSSRDASETFAAMSRVSDSEPEITYGTIPMRSTWERITIAPDIELHVRRPLSRAQNRWLDRLLREVHNLQPEEP
jgi:hypothetical protein